MYTESRESPAYTFPGFSDTLIIHLSEIFAARTEHGKHGKVPSRSLSDFDFPGP